jgi:hypothetical protein
MSPMRRDSQGRREAGTTWESLVERQIREAAEGGAFDDLPYRGEHVPIDDDGTEWALAHHVLRQADVAPPWIETDKRIRELFAEREALLRRAAGAKAGGSQRRREELVRLVREVNVLVFRLEQEAPTIAQHRRTLDLDAELAALAVAEREPR